MESLEIVSLILTTVIVLAVGKIIAAQVIAKFREIYGVK